MKFYEVASSPLLAGLVVGGILIVIMMTLLYARHAWNRSLELGIRKEQLMSVVKSAVIFSVVPSIAIVIGLFALVGFLGKSWSFFRLSVIGSVMYEAFVANGVASSKGWSVVPADVSGSVFVEIMFVMSLCILSGLLFSVFSVKGIQSRTLKAGTGDKSWSTILNSSYFVAILIVYVIQFTLKMFILPNRAGWPAFLTMLTAIVSARIMAAVMKSTGQKWLGDFVVPVSMLLGMASSVLWTNLLLV